MTHPSPAAVEPHDPSNSLGDGPGRVAAVNRLVNVLWLWGVASVVVGVLVLAAVWGRKDGPLMLVGAVATEFVIWGAIDAALAWRGRSRPLVFDPATVGERLDAVRRAVRFNRPFNIAYLTTGVLLLLAAAVWPGAWPALIGHGTGVLIQGGFLFLFDRRLLAAVNA